MTEQEYELLSSSIAHIGLNQNNYAQFRTTGSMENVIHYLSRAVLAQLFWLYLVATVGGLPYVLAWYSSIFVITSLIRDFNWRGHGGNFRHTKKTGWEFDTRSYALNQRFYGYIASEWHDNHHKYPTSANNGFLPGQIDIAFNVIQFLHKFGIVQSYIDSFPRFKDEQLHTA
jgi:stearoyl-CoA desaturase (delta-9 desaturase)